MRMIWAIMKARLREFYRDSASLGWSLLFPFFIIIGFYFIFSEENQTLFQVAVIGEVETLKEPFKGVKYIEFHSTTRDAGVEQIRRHKVDLLLQPGNPTRYWVHSDSAKGAFLESFLQKAAPQPILKEEIQGRRISYIDWVLPGVIAMNLMFSCLWGVGYAIVKYRQDGYLKRLKATPLKAFQFLMGQIGARFVISFFVTSIVLFGSKALIGFNMEGSYLDLFIVYGVGVACLLSIGLLVAARTTSKEFADGLLNVVSWPMMILSEVWFSLDNAGEGVYLVSQFLPLTHLVQATRAIITEGATLGDLWHHIAIMLAFGFSMIALSSLLFKWNEE